jgi:hypothetical protein
LGIEAYELLKPKALIPDNAVSIIEKYTNDIHTAFGKTLETLQKDYISQLRKKKS